MTVSMPYYKQKVFGDANNAPTHADTDEAL
jgi:hypothetical protein